MSQEFEELLNKSESELTDIVMQRIKSMRTQIQLGEDTIKLVGKFYNFDEGVDVIGTLKTRLEEQRMGFILKYTSWYEYNPFFFLSKKAKNYRLLQRAYAAVLKVSIHTNELKLNLNLILQAKDLLDQLAEHKENEKTN